jgi:mono/diheme cytochrome c family protein
MNGGRRALLCAGLLLGGCERGMHDMYEQPRYAPLAPSPLFADGRSARPAPEGAMAARGGVLAGTSSGRHGTVPGEALPRPPVDLALLRRGRQRYEIFCAPCHGLAGDGDGEVAQRGFPAPPSYHQPRLRSAPDEELYAAIRDGYGVMPAYGDRLGEADRWAVVAYLRALQLARRAPAARLQQADRRALDAAEARR